jgi:hypothetical protein
LLVMLDTQAQFMLADFQQCLESPHLPRVHAINAMSCVAVTKVMLVTVCLKRKAATPTYRHDLRDTQGRPSMRE